MPRTLAFMANSSRPRNRTAALRATSRINLRKCGADCQTPAHEPSFSTTGCLSSAHCALGRCRYSATGSRNTWLVPHLATLVRFINRCKNYQGGAVVRLRTEVSAKDERAETTTLRWRCRIEPAHCSKPPAILFPNCHSLLCWRGTLALDLYCDFIPHARVDLPIVAMEQSMQETLQVMLVIMAPSILAVAWMVWRAA